MYEGSVAARNALRSLSLGCELGVGTTYATKAFSPETSSLGDDDAILYRRMFLKCYGDLVRFNAVATNLHLLIDAPEECYLTIGQVACQVAQSCTGERPG